MENFSKKWEIIFGIFLVILQMSARVHCGEIEDASSPGVGVASGSSSGGLLPQYIYDEEPDDVLSLLMNRDGLESDLEYEDDEQQDASSGNVPLKRHLGSVRAASGLRPHPPTANQDLLGFRRYSYNFKRDVPAPLRRFFGLGRRIQRSNVNDDRIFFERPLSLDALRVNNQEPIRGKRFMGSLARGGWFPRQFRGFSGPQWDKRHISAAARIGWVKPKFNRQNEPNFKRNLASVRKNQSFWIPKGQEMNYMNPNLN